MTLGEFTQVLCPLDNPRNTRVKIQMIVQEGSISGNDVTIDIPVFWGDGFLDSFAAMEVVNVYPVSGETIGIELRDHFKIKDIIASW